MRNRLRYSLRASSVQFFIALLGFFNDLNPLSASKLFLIKFIIETTKWQIFPCRYIYIVCESIQRSGRAVHHVVSRYIKFITGHYYLQPKKIKVISKNQLNGHGWLNSVRFVVILTLKMLMIFKCEHFLYRSFSFWPFSKKIINLYIFACLFVFNKRQNG